MKRTNTQIRTLRAMVAGTLVAAGALAGAPASAGGLLLYEIGTEDVGLASAGYTARAQDASTVFTNPAGMTRLDGSQLTAGLQALYGDLGFTIGQGTSPALGSGDGGNPVGWFPGGGAFYSYSMSPDLNGFAATGNLRPRAQIRRRLGGALLRAGRHAGRDVARAFGRISSQQGMVGRRERDAMYAKLHDQVGRSRHRRRRTDDSKRPTTNGASAGHSASSTAVHSTRFGLVSIRGQARFLGPPQLAGLSHALDTVLRHRGLNAV